MRMYLSSEARTRTRPPSGKLAPAVAAVVLSVAFTVQIGATTASADTGDAVTQELSRP